MRKYINSLEKIDKIAWCILLILLGMILFSCESEYVFRPDCEGEEKKEMVCTMEVDLVCGCNGTTYVNACHAERMGVKRVIPLEEGEECKHF